MIVLRLTSLPTLLEQIDSFREQGFLMVSDFLDSLELAELSADGPRHGSQQGLARPRLGIERQLLRPGLHTTPESLDDPGHGQELHAQPGAGQHAA